MKKWICSWLVLLLLFTSSAAAQSDIEITATPLESSECSGVFVMHTLPHTVLVDQQPVRMFESNGAGLAINDLNNDGLLDIVLANIDDPETILWNEGNLEFRPQSLNIPGATRAVIILDMNGDGWRDILFTTQRGAPSLWVNAQDGAFTFAPLPGVDNFAYTMNWADLDSDGDLDLVTGSYDAELERIMTNQVLFNGGAGVYVYENVDGQFIETQLAARAQALTILFTDVTGDGQWDIAVGNDFAELDRYWAQDNGSWMEITPFEIMTHSTMSFDAADVNNDGTQEFFATDMHPYSEDEVTMAAWQPVMETMMAMPMLDGDPQVMVNTMQSITGERYQNVSDVLGVDASGWSWSSKFGDLDSDGFADLYIVNGMIAQDLFGHLPNNELVEENQAFRNVAGSGFVLAPEWGLNATASGRGMSMADLDGDGDLDIVVSNLMSPAALFENQICGGDHLLITLHQPQTPNPDAVGARLVLSTSTGVYQREIRAASGYLSGDASQVHFGLPTGSILESLEIYWPDGEVSRITTLDANTALIVRRS
ncbi:MAG: hypothetical protein OHK0046_00640 [Anaerolineae bacterium]